MFENHNCNEKFQPILPCFLIIWKRFSVNPVWIKVTNPDIIRVTQLGSHGNWINSFFWTATKIDGVCLYFAQYRVNKIVINGNFIREISVSASSKLSSLKLSAKSSKTLPFCIKQKMKNNYYKKTWFVFNFARKYKSLNSLKHRWKVTIFKLHGWW